MGSCCRGRRTISYNQGDPTACRELDNVGAALQIWIMNIRGSYQAVLRRASGEFVTAESFLAAYGCRGPTASALRSNLGRISSAVVKNPTAFQRFVANGAPLIQLLKAVDEVLHAQPVKPSRPVKT